MENNSSPTSDPSRLDENNPIAVEPLQPDEFAPPKRRLIGSMKGKFTVPNDIKTMFAEEIEEMFYGHRAQHKFDDVEEAATERIRQEPKANS